MADIRALMAQERQARRINHEFASYGKSGALMCTACQLNIKSETLWEGHLRSTNHKANVKKAHQTPRVAIKRKIEDVEEEQATEDLDARKKLKPKLRTPSESTQRFGEEHDVSEVLEESADKSAEAAQSIAKEETGNEITGKPATNIDNTTTTPAQVPGPEIDEDEWAAFERDVALLAQPDYSAATIVAAPVTAAQLEAESESDRKRLRDTEAEDEKEDEGRRMEEEFEVMEEMEERIRRLKDKREALRSLTTNDLDTGQLDTKLEPAGDLATQETGGLNDDSDDDDDADDWYS